MRKILLKLKSVLLGTLLVVYLGGCGKDTGYYVDELETKAEEMLEGQSQAETETQNIYVYVCGQIVNPGVYTLPEGSRVCDVFALAGGFTEEASTDYWNQAKLLVDGEMIYVPTIEEAKDRQLKLDEENDNKVNINTASKEELMTIPGIGEAKATAILTYRQENGPFSSIEELMNVAGIKDGVYSKMKDYIKIN